MGGAQGRALRHRSRRPSQPTPTTSRPYTTATDTPQGDELRASAEGQPFLNPDDGSIKTSMTGEEEHAFRVWALDTVGNDEDQGPIYTDYGDIETGLNEVQEGNLDVRDRRGNEERSSATDGPGS